MSTARFVNIASLMTSYNFEIGELPDNLKCSQCKLVLKDACQLPCECRFCRVCIDDMIARGAEFCPGDSEECSETRLSNAAPDYRANKSVSRLAVKCTNSGCVYECSLAAMEEHLRECQRRNEECPFREMGCTQDKLAADEMGGHLLHENRRHSEILIQIISNINRDIETLKWRDEASQIQIENLKRDVKMKDEQIKSIMDRLILVENENKSIKRENRGPPQAVSCRRENDELDSAMTVIGHVATEIDEVATVSGTNKTELTADMKSIIQSINERTESIKNDYCSMRSQLQSIEALVGLALIDSRFDWLINENLQASNWNWRDQASATFSGTAHRYTYGLAASNYINIFENSLDVWFRVFSGPNDAHLQWPFAGRVIITVADSVKPELCRSISRQCRLDKPIDNTYRNTDSFTFPHSELVAAGLDLRRGVRVTCQIVSGGSQ